MQYVWFAFDEQERLCLCDVAHKTLLEHLDHTCRKPLAGKIGSGCDLTWGWMLAAAIRLRDAEFANTMLEKVGLEDFVKANGMFAYIGGRVLKSIEEKRAAYDVKATQPHSITAKSACVRARDYTMIMGTTIFLASLIVIMNLLTDILYKVVDPRIDFE